LKETPQRTTAKNYQCRKKASPQGTTNAASTIANGTPARNKFQLTMDTTELATYTHDMCEVREARRAERRRPLTNLDPNALLLLCFPTSADSCSAAAAAAARMPASRAERRRTGTEIGPVVSDKREEGAVLAAEGT
jgi:hypothetical protein